MKTSLPNGYVAVDMFPLGISSIVVTPHKNTDDLYKKYSSEPDSAFGGELGKLKILQNLYNSLRYRDAMYSLFPNLADLEKEGWYDFMDDCVLFAVLNAVFKKKPIFLVHPTEFKKMNSSRVPHKSKLISFALLKKKLA